MERVDIDHLAAGILKENETRLRQYKSMSTTFELSCRHDNLSYTHHEQVTSLKTINKPEEGKWELSDETDTEKIQELLKIGDWLVDGKRHYGDGLYKKAAGIMEIEESTLRAYKSQSEILSIAVRNSNLTHAHHKEVSSLKTIDKPEEGKWKLSDETDTEKIEEFLDKAEKEKLSAARLRPYCFIKGILHLQSLSATCEYLNPLFLLYPRPAAVRLF